MKTILFTPIISLVLVALLGCSDPTEEDLAAKADEVVPRAQELMIVASFSPEAECRELAGEFAEEYSVGEMPYNDYEPGEAMSRLKQLDKGLDGLEKDLEKRGCEP